MQQRQRPCLSRHAQRQHHASGHDPHETRIATMRQAALKRVGERKRTMGSVRSPQRRGPTRNQGARAQVRCGRGCGPQTPEAQHQGLRTWQDVVAEGVRRSSSEDGRWWWRAARCRGLRRKKGAQKMGRCGNEGVSSGAWVAHDRQTTRCMCAGVDAAAGSPSRKQPLPPLTMHKGQLHVIALLHAGKRQPHSPYSAHTLCIATVPHMPVPVLQAQTTNQR